MVTWQPGMTLDDVERDVIEASLRFNGNNKTRTAASLGIAIRTLTSKLERYLEIDAERELAARAKEEKRNALLQAKRGVHVEQDAGSSEKQPLSVQERQEVQKVPPEQSAQDHTDESHVDGDRGGEEKTDGGQSGQRKRRR